MHLNTVNTIWKRFFQFSKFTVKKIRGKDEDLGVGSNEPK